MRFDFKEIDHGWERLKKLVATHKQGGSYAKAGVLGSSEKRADGIDNVALAAIHEFGVPEKKIPERSFIRGPFLARRGEYIEMTKKLIPKVLAGEIEFVRVLKLVGTRMASDMKRAIERSSGGNEPFVPNKPSTIAKKGSSRPLIDTGQLKRSISYAVVDRGFEDKEPTGAVAE